MSRRLGGFVEDEEVVPQGIDIDGPASSADGDGPPASACGSSNGGLIAYMHFVVCCSCRELL